MYLVDTSALVRLYRRQVSQAWADEADGGVVMISEPVMVETMTIAEAKQYHDIERGLAKAYPWVTVPDGIWTMVKAIRHDLVKPSAYHGVSVADLVIAATAIRLKLTVLHEDADFETIARHVPELRQQRISVEPA